MDWEVILTAVGGAAVLLAAIAWLVRSLIGQLLARDLEGYRYELKANSDRELARVSAALQIEASRDRIRFDVLHAKRAEAIATVYALIAKTQRAARTFATPMEWSNEPSKREKFAALAEVGNALFEYFDEHRIYFSRETQLQFDELYRKIRMSTQSMMDDLNAEEAGRPIRDGRDSWDDAWEAIDQEVPLMRRALEGQMRAVLEAQSDQ